MVLSLVKVFQLWHEAKSTSSGLMYLSNIRLSTHIDLSTRSTAILDVLAQHRQYLAVLPPGWDRTVGRLEGSNSLCPFTASRLANPPAIGIRNRPSIWRTFDLFNNLALHLGIRKPGTCAFRVRHRGRRRLLSSPVINIPVILVKENIILLQLFCGHDTEICIGEGGQEKVAL